MNVNPPSIVLWKFDFTESKKHFPNIVAIVGIKSAPQSTLVADTGLFKGGMSSSNLVKFGFTSILKKKQSRINM